MVLSFYELPKEEMPPQYMWLDEEGLEAWFEAVDERRKQRYGTGSNTESVPDPGGGGLDQNELTRGLKQR